MKPVVMLEEALSDLEEAKEFYERLEKGIGNYFIEGLLADLTGLEKLHGIHSRHFGCFRALSARFPFGIYYLEDREQVRVIAVLDLRRNPNWIRTEVSRRGARE
jgi:plasmid stabilization system protein ParE